MAAECKQRSDVICNEHQLTTTDVICGNVDLAVLIREVLDSKVRRHANLRSTDRGQVDLRHVSEISAWCTGGISLLSDVYKRAI